MENNKDEKGESDDIYFTKKKKKFKSKMGMFKPSFSIDMNDLGVVEPTETVTDSVFSHRDAVDVLRKVLKIDKFKYEDYERIKRIAVSQKGPTWKVGKKKGTKRFYSMKELSLNKPLFEEGGKWKLFESEIIRLFRLKHDNITSLEDFYIRGDRKCYLIHEYMNLRDPESILKKSKHIFPESAISDLIKQLLEGLKCLHDQGIIHRNLKTKNIFVNNLGECKIGDISLPTMNSAIEQAFWCFTGEGIFCCPQRFVGERYDSKTDIWNVGEIAIHLLTGEPPWDELLGKGNMFEGLKKMEKRVNEKSLLKSKKWRMSKSPKSKKYDQRVEYTKEFEDFLYCCLCVDPKKRWDVDQLLEHPFILKYSIDRGSKGLRNWMRIITGKKSLVIQEKEEMKDRKERTEFVSRDLIDLEEEEGSRENTKTVNVGGVMFTRFYKSFFV